MGQTRPDPNLRYFLIVVPATSVNMRALDYAAESSEMFIAGVRSSIRTRMQFPAWLTVPGEDLTTKYFLLSVRNVDCPPDHVDTLRRTFTHCTVEELVTA